MEKTVWARGAIISRGELPQVGTTNLADVYVTAMRHLTTPAEAISDVGSCIAGYNDIHAADRYLHPWIICSVLRDLAQGRGKLPSQYFFYGRDINMVPALAHIVGERAETRMVSVYEPYALSLPARSGLFIPRLR
jgi:hypothetical protein